MVSALTGRQAINLALRTALDGTEWRPRAAGWFTRSDRPEWVDVLVTGIAVQGMAAGEAVASLYVSSRHEEVEGAVAALCEIKDSYRQRTVITTIDNLAPAGRRSSWHVTPAAADQVASEMRIAINTWGEPWCRAITNDDELVLSETSRGWLLGSAVEMTRHLVAIHLLRGADAAATAVDEASRCLVHQDHGIAAASKVRALRRFESTLTT